MAAIKPLSKFLEETSPDVVRLHLGCGGVRWKDFINVDLYPPEKDRVDSSRSGFSADAIGDMTALGIPDGSVDEIFTSHTIDHFTKWRARGMFRHWLAILRPGGRLVIEVADFNRCLLWLFHPVPSRRRAAMNQFYGNQWDEIDYETHRYVWSAREIRKELSGIGFVVKRINHRTETHYQGRDMRIEAVKPA